MVDLEKAITLIREADAELHTLQHKFNQQHVELQQVRNRLQREQDRSRGLEEQVADLETQIAQLESRRADAVAATLAHESRTT